MDITLEQKALLAISELRQTILFLEVQRDRAKTVYEGLTSRIEALREQLIKIES